MLSKELDKEARYNYVQADLFISIFCFWLTGCCKPITIKVLPTKYFNNEINSYTTNSRGKIEL